MDYKEKVIALLNNQELSKEQKEKLEDISPELAESEDEKIKRCISDAVRKYGVEFATGTKCAYNGIVDAFCFVDVSRYTDIAYGGIMTATKEQRDLLFKKMKESGYEWDAEKKELKKIEENPTEIEDIEHGKYYYCIKDYYSGGCKRASKGEVVQALRGMSMMALGVKANEYFIPVMLDLLGVKKIRIYVRPAWSEEDKDLCYDTLSNLTELKDRYGEGYGNVGKCIDWLKSLKDRMKGE